MSQPVDTAGKIWKFRWIIKDFSSIAVKKLYSEDFTVEGNKWRILIYPKGNNVDLLSIYLAVADSERPSGWIRYAQFGLAVIDRTDRKASITRVSHSNNHRLLKSHSYSAPRALDQSINLCRETTISSIELTELSEDYNPPYNLPLFLSTSASLLKLLIIETLALMLLAVATYVFNAKEVGWGFTSFLSLTELHNPLKGYLVNDACLVEAYVSTDTARGLISHELILETDSATGNQKTTITRVAEISQPLFHLGLLARLWVHNKEPCRKIVTQASGIVQRMG
ncbi:hypothetical protein GQ457_09G027310 [Hibiscus cannabinus]